jgi:hypothetical protein
VIADLTPYGASVWVPGDVNERIEEVDEQIPQSVVDIWRRAPSLGRNFVHLDCDANTYEELPSYAWS